LKRRRNYEGKTNSYDKLILKLLPPTINLNQSSLYSRLLEICHYVASLSDRKALNVYNKITGVEYK
jgi:dGTPase